MKYLWFKNGMTVYASNNATLDEAIADGAAIIRENDDGTTSIIYDGASWIEEKPDIDASQDSFIIVAPSYVDDRMAAVIDVFDALEAIMFPEAEPAAEQSATPMRKAARKITPEEAFKSALDMLKAITQGGEA